MTLENTVQSITTEYADTLAIESAAITSKRADAVMTKVGVQTTTELLLLLARFHADVDDAAGSEMLAAFAAKFAAVESQAV